MQAEILLTLKLQGSLFADPRRIALLKQIKATGSISQGAKLAGISYKSAWDAINEMNQLTDDILVDRATGGKGGGGTTLTHYGERLLQLYDLLAQIQQKAFDVLKEDNLPLDSLLAAISRFSLQTSARNQFFGTLISRDHMQVQQHVQIRLSDNSTVINAALTEQSANRLGLTEGKEVLALIKAPWVKITKQPAPTGFDNHLEGKITTLERGNENSEVIVTLTGGETLCSTMPNSEIDSQSLKVNNSVTALFNADQVIIATLC
ncbi:molybdenum-dependent transcriptional regulator [Providencia huaxiensis]|uniref:Molybdenum-dependent transcriptional regulator n=1 Tax=Providencia huaxiensis TaxID=2027290 RepID=A0A8I2DAP1_9GAMM|nr:MULTISPECIES: molybdenum-dependent transcriptional regulator [Providencia]MBN6359905.1 molybdenum-dependent transcriptional regulator [Providencia huaxiensis]MBQ0268356.1 molybdenum-dependent transcriptional regulator [Providencia huaxiensis]MCD2528974.1 molybdenum-dependent transcriptional regulator [Providencia huaxiensis]QPE18592.1 molybdenum-dependent transcriptional regulator [Providencia rettgeri]